MNNKIVRTISALIVLALMVAVMPFAALADDSTTMEEHAYKDISPNTELYALTDTPGASYVNYGAKYEPNGGILYGRTSLGGSPTQEVKDAFPGLVGGYGQVNALENANESVIGFYTDFEDQYDLNYWSYLFKPSLSDGEHSLLIYLNFNQEGEDCPKVVSGQYDEKLKTNFEYLATLDCPVFMRVGGEVNVWTKAATPDSYIAAFRHIAQLRTQYAPNVALVYSPNYSSAYQSDMDDWYPGDAYVDWIGVSLYYNKEQYYNNVKVTDMPTRMFSGVGDVYGDPVLNVQMTVNLSKLHKKPLIVTEGGAANLLQGETIDSGWVAERMQKEMAFLPMLYPQIKAIVLTDYKPGKNQDYTFYNNPTITAGLRRGVKGLGVYLADYHGTGKYLTPLSDSPDLATATSGDVRLFAYTYSSGKLTATLYIDNAPAGTSSDYPYAFTVSRDTLLAGSHTVRVEFSNNQKISYTITNGKVAGKDAAVEEPSGWAKEEVYKAIGLGVVPLELQKGYTNPITRAQFAALAVQFYETLKGTEITGRKTFTDTNDVNVQKLAYLGVVNGVGDGSAYDPGGIITREQAAKIISELANSMGHPLSDSPERPVFKDMDQVGSWAEVYIGKVASNAIMWGDTDDGRGNFKPKDTLTVEQSIMTLVRLVRFVG